MASKFQTHLPKHLPGDKIPMSFAYGSNSVCDESETGKMINCPVCGKPIRGDQGIMDKIVLDGSGGKVFVHATVHSWCV